MTYRSTCSDLVTYVRGFCALGTADYTVNSTAYWTNDQIQDVIDRYRHDFFHELMQPVQKHIGGGSVEYYDYYIGHRWIEKTSGGSAIFIVENSTGTDAGTATWSADYQRGIVSFASNTGGSTYYVTGRRYDLHAAAADIWRQKAAHYAVCYDVRTDEHQLTRSQMMKQAMEMCSYYENESEPSVFEFGVE